MNSSELRGYLTGLILGDGTIGKGVKKRSFEIKSVNKDFIEEIYENISSCTNFKIEVKEIPYREDEHGVKHKAHSVLYIKAHPYFNKKYNYFYNDNRKRRITTESLSWITLQGLANWYMSDGYICLVGKTKGEIKSRRIDLCTDRYSLKDVEKIQKYFKDVWGWETSIIRRKNKGKIFYRLRFKMADAQNFLYKISPFVTESFKYKLNLHYDYQPKWMNDEYYHLMKEIEKCEYPTLDEGDKI